MGRFESSYPPSAQVYEPRVAPMASSSTAHLKQETETAELPNQPEDAPAKKHWMDKGFNSALGPINVRRFAKKSYIKWYILLLIICVLVGLMTIYHDQIIKWFEPFAKDLKDMPGSWAIPVGILIVLSFPPLFGHEIVGMLCGVIWPLWTAFGIVALGTLLGELANFFVFKYACTKRAQRYERNDVTYACMVKVVQEGGFWVILVARFSAIPGHLTTPVFSTCGVSIFIFTLTAILTLPKQLQVVYLGTIFNQPEDEKSTTAKWVQNGVLAFSFVITLGAAWWLYRKMAHWRPIVEKERAERAEAKELSRGNSLLTVPSSRNDRDMELGDGGHSTERLTDHAEPPAGYHYVDPYQSSPAAAAAADLPYNMPAHSSSSIALHAPQGGVVPTIEHSAYDQGYRQPQQQRYDQEDLSAYTSRQTQLYTSVVATPPGSRRPSLTSAPRPTAPQAAAGQIHPSSLYPSQPTQQGQHQPPQQQQPTHQPRSSADYYRPQSGYYGQAL